MDKNGQEWISENTNLIIHLMLQKKGKAFAISSQSQSQLKSRNFEA